MTRATPKCMRLHPHCPFCGSCSLPGSEVHDSFVCGANCQPCKRCLRPEEVHVTRYKKCPTTPGYYERLVKP